MYLRAYLDSRFQLSGTIWYLDLRLREELRGAFYYSLLFDFSAFFLPRLLFSQ